MNSGLRAMRLGLDAADMHVLITGNRGYIGNVLSERLLNRGEWELVGLDSGLFDKNRMAQATIRFPQLRKDIRDVEPEDLSGIDVVIHLAALSNDPLGNLDPQLTFEINHQASVRLAEVAKSAGVRRFLFSSSCSVYGAGQGDMWFDEQSKCFPVTPYAKSKLIAEEGLAELAEEGFDVIILRNATAYGIGVNLRFDLAVNNLVAWTLSTGNIFIKSDGLAWRPFVHVADIAQAFEVFLGRQMVAPFQVFNVGATAENYQVKRVAEMIAEVIPGSRIVHGNDAEPDARNYRVNCERLKTEIAAFDNKWTVLEGIHELYRELRGMELKPEEFEGPKYNRISYLRDLLASGQVDESLRWVSSQ